MSYIRYLKLTLPPFIITIARKVRNLYRYSKGFNTWDDALQNTTSYNKNEIIDKVLSSARLVRDGVEAYERDSVLFNKVQYDYELLSALLLIVNTESRLHLIDFGGALGTSYRQNKKYLDCLSVPIKWGVIEQSEFVKIGRREFQTDSLQFFDNFLQVQFDVDLVLMGSSLCYLENPYSILSDIMEVNPSYILIIRTPFTESDNEEISIQNVPSNIYKASYPFWTLSKSKLIKFLSEKYELFEEWDDALQAYPDKSYGLLFRKIKLL